MNNWRMSIWTGPEPETTGRIAPGARDHLASELDGVDALRMRQFVILLCLTTFASLSAFSFYLYPSLLAHRGVSESSIGVVMGAFYVGSFIGMVAMPRAFRAMGGKRALFISCAAFGLISLSLLPDMPLQGIIALRMLQGVAWGMILISTAVASLNLMGARRLAEAGAVYGACFLVGQALGPAIGELVTRRTGWPAAPLLISALAALVATAIVPFLGRQAFAVAPASSVPLRLVPILQPLAATFLVSAGFGGATSFIVNYATEHQVLPVSAFFLGSLASGLVLRLIVSRYLDRFSRERVSALAALLNMLGLVAVIHLGLSIQLWIAGAFMGAAAAIYSGSLQAMAVERSRDRVSAVTAFRGAVTLGVAISSVAGGIIIDRFGYNTLFALLAGASMLAILLMLRPMGMADATRP